MKTLAFALVVGACAAAASADVLNESTQFAGAWSIDFQTGQTSFGDAGARATTIYSNRASPANFAVSSTDLTSIWGDAANTTGTGTLEQFSFTLFNSTNGGQNTMPLASAIVGIQFNRMSDNSVIGGFNVNTGNINLNPGFYTVLTVTGLQGLGIDLDATDLLVLQTASDIQGGTSRIGIASLDPVLVGSSPTTMYIESDTVNGGVPGFYSFSGPANPGYEIIVPAPASLALLGLAGLAGTRRRR